MSYVVTNVAVCSGRWVHLLCALCTPGVQFEDTEGLRWVSLDFILPWRWSSKVYILYIYIYIHSSHIYIYMMNVGMMNVWVWVERENLRVYCILLLT